MKVILVRDCAAGRADSIVVVRDGYAKNYLIPQGLALPYTQRNVAQLEATRSQREEHARKERAKAQKLLEQLERITLEFELIQSGNHTHGRVTTKQILNTLSAQHNIELPKHVIDSVSLNTIGEHRIVVRPHSQIEGRMRIIIKAAE